MEMNIVIGALQNKTFPGRVTMIAPKEKMKTEPSNSRLKETFLTPVMNTLELDFLPMAKLF